MGRLTSDLTGMQFRRLTVLGPAGVHITARGRERLLWRVRCSCNNELVVMDIALQEGRKLSCGCLRAERLARRAEQLDDLPSRTKPESHHCQTTRHDRITSEGVARSSAPSCSTRRVYSYPTNRGLIAVGTARECAATCSASAAIVLVVGR